MPRTATIVPVIATGALLGWAAIVGFDLRHDAPIAAEGGAEFARQIELPVAMLPQGDPRWATEPLGPSRGTLGSEGCAVASAAMVLNFHGAEIDPGRLNRALTAIPGGYTAGGWLYWEKAAEVTRASVAHAYEGPPRHRLIDRNLARGNPVIARVRMPTGTTHFVVICGKDKDQYIIRDPGARHAPRLSDLQAPVEAIRYYLPRPRTDPGQSSKTPSDNFEKMSTFNHARCCSS
ncbi:MAG TPA: C39 family peptidase [Verrucomicrobiae bacterium]|nr:C39 family peptidase [Verrucomicrobiae bacterium]